MKQTFFFRTHGSCRSERAGGSKTDDEAATCVPIEVKAGGDARSGSRLDLDLQQESRLDLEQQQVEALDLDPVWIWIRDGFSLEGAFT